MTMRVLARYRQRRPSCRTRWIEMCAVRGGVRLRYAGAKIWFTNPAFSTGRYADMFPSERHAREYLARVFPAGLDEEILILDKSPSGD